MTAAVRFPIGSRERPAMLATSEPPRKSTIQRKTQKKARLGATVPSGDGGGVLVHLPLERPLTAAGENDRPNDPLRCQGLSPARPFHKGLCVTNDTFFGCLCYSHDRHDHGWIDKIKLFG